ncbi:MAG: helix-turn-helix transcriptional regulator [Sphingomonadaceae bacterium]|nr:helix-turn-helix transcriptional regulator [Sphingomonadaceae bacterium]
MGHLIEQLTDLGDENCGLPAALEAMGERWSFLILRAAFNGLKHFEEMQSSLGIARNILANRLGRLVVSGILERTPCPDDRRKVEYRLTEKGESLLPAMIALRQWGERFGTGIPSDPVLCDKRDGQPIATVGLKAHDGRALEWHDLMWLSQRDLAAREAAE